VEALTDLLGVPLVVELQEAGEDFAAGRLADREPGALLGLVEAVAEVVPSAGGGDGPVHLDVEVAERLDVGGGFVGVLEAVAIVTDNFLPAVAVSPCAVRVRWLFLSTDLG